MQLFAFDTVKRTLTPKDGSPPNLPGGLPVATVAGASAGLASTLCTYPLELLKTRLTIQVSCTTSGLKNLIQVETSLIRDKAWQRGTFHS